MKTRVRPFTRLSIITFFFLIILGRLYAAGIPDDSFSTWYGDLANRYALEEVQNTGLTAFPTLDVPMGGEYEALGSAYTAAARDITYLEANPAASSNLSETEVGVFHNNLIADTNLESAAYTTRFEHLGTGVGLKYLHVPFTEYDDFGVQQGTARYTEAIGTFNLSYNFFNSFYFDGVALGGNVKFAYRNIPEIIEPNQSAAGILADFGMQTKFDFLKFYPSHSRNVAVGTVLRNVGPNVLNEPPPTTWSAGVAYNPLRPWLLSADIDVPLMLFSNESPPPMGYAFGTALTVTEFFAVRGGYQLKGGNPRVSVGSSVRIENMTVTINYTLDMTTQLVAFDRFSLQAGFSLGDRGRAQRQETVRSLYLDALEAFAVGDLERTIQLTEDALAIDATFQPASETLQMATRMLELQQRMERIRTGADTEFTDDATPSDTEETPPPPEPAD